MKFWLEGQTRQKQLSGIEYADEYKISDFEIKTMDIGKKEPLAVVKIVMMKDGNDRTY